ncbi:type II toxin-antitoxin system RelE/ParE family toxin [Candidatus Thorarchaeota archaeon]|nr:type II toxin-antitoxin system RelE/ParE family toxin [Candidatus Thorarchaeota archaeon]TFG95975.1 MAG: type II toxin-antitoxin system RelE/ParE family toxin [Candidatus Thorarchaeota archaeon]
MRSSFHLTKFSVLLSQTAVSQLSLLNSKQKKRIKDALLNLEENPFRKRSGVDIKKLVTPDEPPLFRLRIGDYRAIYFVLENEIRVTEIIHRSKGYKWLE